MRRLTENGYIHNFPALSPEGTRIVFESNRLRAAGEPPQNTLHLLLMNTDSAAQMPLVRGNFGTWSPDGKRLLFHVPPRALICLPVQLRLRPRHPVAVRVLFRPPEQRGHLG